MKIKPKIVTLCGSTKFKNQFNIEEKRFTLDGYIVLTVHIFSHAGDENLINDERKEMLMELHKHKIDLSDEIYVINVDGYIGDGLIDEIQYAMKCNKKINYMTPIDNRLNNFELKCKDLKITDEEILIIFQDFVIENENDISIITDILQQYRKNVWNKFIIT